MEKRLKEVRKSYIFETSIDSSQIPPQSSVWSADQTLYPKVDSTTLSALPEIDDKMADGRSIGPLKMAAHIYHIGSEVPTS